MAVKRLSRHTALHQGPLPAGQMESKTLEVTERECVGKIPQKVLTEGTAKQETDLDESKFSYIAQATGVGNQKLIPSCEKAPFIATPNSYSHQVEKVRLETVLNNVVRGAEGKVPGAGETSANGTRPRRRRGNRKSRQRSRKKREAYGPGTKPPEQESCPPIPVQEDQAENTSDICGNSSRRHEVPVFVAELALAGPAGLDSRGIYRLREDDHIASVYRDIQQRQADNFFAGSVKQSNVRPFPTSLNSPTMFYINDDGLDTGKRLPESVTAQETSPPLFAGRGDFVGAEHRKEPLSEPGLVASALRGIVIHEDPKYFVHHCRKWEEYGERWRQGQKVPNTNEGLLQHQDLRPVEHEYGEDSHWSLIPGRLGTGSFGDVYMARDHSSNFTCAAKQEARWHS
eukprot:gi/632977839/ref/XP_007905571.1/ PREDICTED: mitogen-activated protein kinase kinase kinase 14 [Callorhinchus milii]